MKNILIVRLSSLGDIVLTQPITAVLKRKFPLAMLTYVTKEQFIPIVQAMGTIDRVVAYRGTKTVLPELRYDLMIDLHNKLSTWFLRRRTKANRKVVYDKKHLLRRFIVWKLSKQSIPSTLSLYAAVLDKTGVSEAVEQILPDPELQILSSIDPLEKIDRKGRKLVGLFPGAAHETKMYPLSNWVEVINGASGNCLFLLLGNPAEEHLCRFLYDRCPDRSVMPGCQFDLEKLIRIISECDLVLSNDSGPMHIAAALGKRQIAIFGATHPRLGFRPMNQNAVIFCRDLHCQPCSLHGGHSCPQGHFRCMREISPGEIISKLDELLGE